MLLQLLLLGVVCPVAAVWIEDDLVFFPSAVVTTHGPVQGVVRVYSGTKVHVYKGVPYAAPPTGHLRFAPPQPPAPWTETMETVHYRNRCMAEAEFDGMFYQAPRVAAPVSEDCLHLTVVAPQSRGTGKKAVMVHIHGGALVLGSSSDIGPEALAIAGDVIHVAMNYRLGIFGFLALEDDSAPGNVGFLDQVLALRWVKDNIAAFGGDPDRVTIFGISAGGWSVSAHVVSPMSRGLFKHAISQSGSLYGYRLETREERAARSRGWAVTAGCQDNLYDVSMLACLRKLTSSELVKSTTIEFFYMVNTGAMVDGHFLPDSVTHLYDEHMFPPEVDFVIGTMSEEGDAVVSLNYAPPDVADEYFRSGVSRDDPLIDAILNYIIWHMRLQLGPEGVAALKQLITNHYIDDLDDDLGNLRGLMDAFADEYFVAPSVGTARRVAEAGHRVHMYWFNQTPAVPLEGTAWGQPHLAANPRLNVGAKHGLDMFYMFAHALVPDAPDPACNPEKLPEADRDVARSMVHAWTTFAKTGNMEYLLEGGTVAEWPQYEAEGEKYLEWRSPMTSSSVKSRLRTGGADFWNILLPATLREWEPRDKGRSQEHRKDEL